MAGLKPLLKDIADAIRNRSGNTTVIPATEFVSKIKGLYVVSNQVFDGGGASLACYGSTEIFLFVRIPSGAKITFDGKQLIVPVEMALDYGYGYRTSRSDIIISF